MNEDLAEGMAGITRRRFLSQITSMSALLGLPGGTWDAVRSADVCATGQQPFVPRAAMGIGH